MAGDRIEIYRARRGLLFRAQWRARVLGGNNRVIFVSAESYNNLGDLMKQVERLFPTLPVNVKE